MTSKQQDATLSAKLLIGYTLNPEFQKKYVLGQELGHGGFGFVLSAFERETGIERAVKFIMKTKIPSSALIWDPDMGHAIPMEIYTLKHVRHENIIQFYDAYQDDTYFYLVMEIYGAQWSTSTTTTTTTETVSHSPGLSQNSHSTIDTTSTTNNEDECTLPRQFARRTSCDLFECIEQHKYFEEDRAKMIFKQIVDCVAYLDRMGACHRDIKDENIVIDQDYKVKLIDFGSTVVLKRGHLFTRFYGTLAYASPEVLLSRPYRAEPAEIWSLGVLLFTLLFGEIPFPDTTSAIEGRMTKPNPNIQVSRHCKHLIRMLLLQNPEERPNIHQVLCHPWFS